MTDVFNGLVKRSGKDVGEAIDNFARVWNAWCDRRAKLVYELKNTPTRFLFIFKSNAYRDMLQKTRFEIGILYRLKSVGYISKEEFDFWDSHFGWAEINVDTFRGLKNLYTSDDVDVYVTPDQNRMIKKYQKPVDIPAQYVTITA